GRRLVPNLLGRRVGHFHIAAGIGLGQREPARRWGRRVGGRGDGRSARRGRCGAPVVRRPAVAVRGPTAVGRTAVVRRPVGVGGSVVVRRPVVVVVRRRV